MNWWLFFGFHILSLVFCLMATRATFRYLSKYRMTPQTSFLMVGLERTQYVALFYVGSILILTLLSLAVGIFHFFS